MNFSQALDILKEGHLHLFRTGWNGKDMYIYLEKHAEDDTTYSNRTYEPFIAMRTAQLAYIPWLASQSDLLAEDWELVGAVDVFDSA